ncbi:hypothetical protein QAD02_018826 [Eretmocerus hayati]|uniref:Uncharacterized protein n=1 Tax=Eretmocerus hayati TaxID=131215 RepID=A0ACC2PHG1_9HYME|nr:hypothetical protein QAD02_018826 [Eretmocerus hayati]
MFTSAITVQPSRPNNLISKTTQVNPDTSRMMDSILITRARSEMLQILDAGLSSVMPIALVRDKVSLSEDGTELLLKVGDDDEQQSRPLGERVVMVGFGKAVAGMACTLAELLGPRLVRCVLSVPRIELGRYRGPDTDNDVLPRFRQMRDAQVAAVQALARTGSVEILEGAENNQPDESSLAATERIIELVRDLGDKDSLLVLVSGGGSALLCRPVEPLGLEQKRQLCLQLQNAGASISELNRVRKRLSDVKGGGLARIAYPAKVTTLLLSDVVGDPIDLIASGPTVYTDDSVQEAIDILKKYEIYDSLRADVKEIFSNDPKKMSKASSDKGMVEKGKFKFVENIVIGNNKTGLLAAQQAAEKLNFKCIVLTSFLEGDVKDISYSYAKFTRICCQVLEKHLVSENDFIEKVRQETDFPNLDSDKLSELFQVLSALREDETLLILAGGEPTVTVTGDGKGGRNQELSLRFSLDWLAEISKYPVLARYFVMFLSVGSDGQDGPTDAAGAFGLPNFRPELDEMYQSLVSQKKLSEDKAQLEALDNRLRELENLLPENVLKRNDSYHFFSSYNSGKNLLKFGLSGTNVMDFHFLYLRRRGCHCS